MFKKLADQFSQKVALISDCNQIITYNDIQLFSDRLKINIEEHSFVFCLCENSVGSLSGYFSFIRNGIVPLMLDATINKEMLDNLITIYQPNYLWLNDTLLVSYPDNKVKFSEYNYSLIQINKNKVELNDELAVLLTTSGSTGSPKLVRLSYKNIQANAESIALYLNLSSKEKPITSLPMHYSYGLSVINSHLISGATILLTDSSIAQKEFWTFAKEQKATSMAGVPYTYEMLKRLHFFRMSLPDMKVMTQAGGKLSVNLVREFVENAILSDKKFIVMYGQTEATARMSYLPFESAFDKSGSIGIAIPGGSFKLIDDNGKEILDSNSDGELVYQGENVSLGYAECKDDLIKGDENNGILYTGDIARRDEDGFYYITGRKKRFIKIYGNRVNLDAAEQIIKEIVPSCACVGDDDKMVIYITDSSKSDQIRNLLSEKTGLNSRAFEVRFISEIPKNTSGKVLYSNLLNE
jgi:acyl-CoA synthetase (AMP-forming)/AMP-acid ligase II